MSGQRGKAAPGVSATAQLAEARAEDIRIEQVAPWFQTEDPKRE